MESSGRKRQSTERHRRRLVQQRNDAIQEWFDAAQAWADVGPETANAEAVRLARESLERRMDEAACSFEMAQAALGEPEFDPV